MTRCCRCMEAWNLRVLSPVRTFLPTSRKGLPSATRRGSTPCTSGSRANASRSTASRTTARGSRASRSGSQRSTRPGAGTRRFAIAERWKKPLSGGVRLESGRDFELPVLTQSFIHKSLDDLSALGVL